MRVCVCTYTYTHIHIHINTHTHSFRFNAQELCLLTQSSNMPLFTVRGEGLERTSPWVRLEIRSQAEQIGMFEWYGLGTASICYISGSTFPPGLHIKTHRLSAVEYNIMLWSAIHIDDNVSSAPLESCRLHLPIGAPFKPHNY